jgi:hypothetical protein
MVYYPEVTFDAGPARSGSFEDLHAGIQKRENPMLKKTIICAVIALILVPASVMAAGFGGNSTGAAAGLGPCMQDGQNCMNQTGQQGTGTQEQYRYGMQQNKGQGTGCSGDGQCTGEPKQARSMLRLHDGSGKACKNSP